MIIHVVMTVYGIPGLGLVVTLVKLETLETVDFSFTQQTLMEQRLNVDALIVLGTV